VQVVNQREEMEAKIIQQNKHHHSKVLQSKMYKDRIYNYLLENEMRDRILNGNLCRDEYDNNDIFNFLLLLKRNFTNSYSTTIYQPIIIDEWKEIVKKAKRMSTSSIFSRRNYSI